MKAPIVDNRKFKELVDEMKELVPYFCPEWKFSPDNPDVGTALFMVIALQLQETIDLFNRSLDKNLISFLNYMNISLKPPKPAKVPLVFNLSEGAKNSVVVKSKTRVFGRGDSLEKLVSFETDSLMEVTPSKIRKAFCTSQQKDSIVKIHDTFEEQAYFKYDKDNLQEHAIYISTEYILTCSKPMEFDLIFDYPFTDSWPDFSILTNKDFISWQFSTEESWHEFDSIRIDKNIITLVKDNHMNICKSQFKDMKWIRCVLKKEKIAYLKDLFIDRVYLLSRLIGNEREVLPDNVYLNDKPINKESFYPFGEFFNQYDTFYINSEDILSKKDSEITLSFNIELEANKLSNQGKDIDWKLVMKSSEINKLADPKVSIHTVKWYYYNGVRWELIEVDKRDERLFYYLNETKKVKVRFTCPKDVAPVEVNGEVGYFIKAVIDRVENYVHTDGIYMSPKIDYLKMTYDYVNKLPLIENFICHNNLEYEDNYNKLNSSGVTFYPFKGVGHIGNCLYILLDNPLTTGPINLLFLINKINNEFIYNKKMTFEYMSTIRGEHKWVKVKVHDETKGLTQDGIISLSSLNNFTKKKLFNEEGYWLRLSFNEEDKITRYIKGIYLNGVWATQQLSIKEEFIEFNENTKEIFLTEVPIIEEELWVNEIDSLGQKEISEILQRKDMEIKTSYDYLGVLKELWIKWQAVEHFYHGGPNDRIYTIDRLTGQLKFADGVSGKVPKTDMNKSIYASYKVGGGQMGNMRKNTINQLEEPIAFIDKVFNPDKGSGGANTELLDEAIRRGIRSIRNRKRGVTIHDIQDLIKDVSSDIYKVKCIKNVTNKMNPENGALNLIVLLKEKILDGMSYILKNQIEEYLFDKIPCNLMGGTKLYVSDPEIIEINLKVNLTCKTNFDKATIRENLNTIVKRFLNYKTGNYGNRGWDIGEMPRETTFYSILSEQEGVLNVDNINMNVYVMNKFEKKEISIKDAIEKKNSIIISGEHKFYIYSI